MTHNRKFVLLAGVSFLTLATVTMSQPASAADYISGSLPAKTTTTTLAGTDGADDEVTLTGDGAILIATTAAAGSVGVNVTGIPASAPINISTAGTASIIGGTGAAGSNGPGTVNGSAGGAAVVVQLTADGTIADHAVVTHNSSSVIRGGAGGAGNTSSTAQGGNGAGGAQGVYMGGDYGEIFVHDGSIVGGAGGAGGQGDAAFDGGNGGNGSRAVDLVGAHTSLVQDAGTSVVGGAGGVGGAGNGTGRAGAGGVGGYAVYAITGTDQVLNLSGIVTGGAGGNGGVGGANEGGDAGAGGAGGAALYLNSTSADDDVDFSVQTNSVVTGGAGGNGGVIGGGDGGAGGAGGVGVVVGTSATSGMHLVVNGSVVGGKGGNATGTATTGNGGRGVIVQDIGSASTAIIDITGSVTGGLNGTSTTRATALDFAANTGKVNLNIDGATIGITTTVAATTAMALSNSSATGGDVVTFEGVNTVNGAIATSSDSTSSNGTLNVQSGTTTVTGNIGSTGAGAVSSLNFTDTLATGTLNSTADVFASAMNFGDDSTLNLNSANGGSSIGSVSITTTNNGTIRSANTSGTNTIEDIGTTTKKLKLLNLTGAGGTTSITDDFFVTTVDFDADATLDLNEVAGSANVTTVTTATDGTGTIISRNSSGTNTFGNVGETARKLKALTISSTGGVAVTGSVYVDTISFAADGTLTLSEATGGHTIDAITTTGTTGTGKLVVSNTSGTNTFGDLGTSAKHLKSITMAGAGTTRVTDDFFVNSIAFSADGTLDLDKATGGHSITAVTTTTTNTGTVSSGNSSGTNTLSDLGTTTHKLKSLTISGTGTTAVTDDFYVNAVAFTADGVLDLNEVAVTTDTSVATSVTTNVNSTGTLTTSHTSGIRRFDDVGTGAAEIKAFNMDGGGTGTVNVLGDFYATNVSIAHGNTLALTGAPATTTKELSGVLVNNGTIDLHSDTLVVAGNITGANGTIRTTIGATQAGNIVNTGNTINPTFTTALTIAPTVTGIDLGNGDKVVLIHSNAASAAAALPTINIDQTSLLLTWNVAAATSASTDVYGNAIEIDDIVLTSQENTAADVDGVSSSNADSIDAILGQEAGADSNLVALKEALESITDVTELNKAGAQLRPDINGAGQQAALGATNQALHVISMRNDNLRFGPKGLSGVGTGKKYRRYGIWGQGFGSMATQDARDDVDGYEAKSAGFVLGADARVTKKLSLGGSLAFAKTNVDDAGAREGSGQKVNSYIGTIYGFYSGKPWYLDGSFTYGLHKHKSTRVVDFLNATAQTAQGEFDSGQYGMRAEFGYPIKFRKKSTITPLAAINYNNIDQDGYTETGAAGANLAVEGASANSFRSNLGAKFATRIGVTDGWTVQPTARMIWAHEFNADAQEIVAQYTAAGGTSFTTQGLEPPANAAIVGFGFDFLSAQGSSMSLKYDAEVKEAFLGHTGVLQYRKSF